MGLVTGLAARAVAGRPARPGPRAAAGVPLPRGSRPLESSGPELLFSSARGFHDTVLSIRRWLRKQGLPARELPVYRRHGVAVARFLAPAGQGHWRAIHVFERSGRTYLAVVPAVQGPIPGPRPAPTDPGASPPPAPDPAAPPTTPAPQP